MQTPLISVVVPVYNAEKYLVRCMESLLRQSYQNFEILLVDDGSKDSSSDICDRYAQQDSRVQVIHKPNGGVSSARNLGLDRMRGEYCVFVDSDDYVSSLLLQRLMDACRETDTQLAVCDWKMVLPDSTIPESVPPKSAVQRIAVDETCRYTAPYAHSCVYAALISAQLLEDIRFDSDLYIGEDALLFAKVMKKTKQLAYISEELYYYVVYAQSAIHGAYTIKRQTEIEAWKRIGALFADGPSRIRHDCTTKLATAYFAGLRCMLEGENSSTATPEQYLAEAKKLKKYVFQSKLPVSYKFGYALMCLSPGAYMLVFRLFNK